jgi:hypothetical protein
VNASQAIERVMVAAGCVYSLLFVAAFACCAGCLRSCLSSTIEFRAQPTAVMSPPEVLGWLVRIILKAMYPFLFDESR